MSDMAKVVERLIDRLINAEHARDAALTQRDAAKADAEEMQDDWEFTNAKANAAIFSLDRTYDRLRRVIAIARAIRAERDQAIVIADLYQEKFDDEEFERQRWAAIDTAAALAAAEEERDALRAELADLQAGPPVAETPARKNRRRRASA